MIRRSVILLSAALVASHALPGCLMVGADTIGNGRAVYNEVINKTEDEQVLGIILRERYDETFGMLSVGSVTASISLRSNVGADFGFGPDRNYDGNLVPLSAGVAYEENPTISYVPINGEVFYQRSLAPPTLEHTFLMAQAAEDRVSMFRLMIERLNGIPNPPPGREAGSEELNELRQALDVLNERRLIELVRAEQAEQYYIAVHRYDGSEDYVQTMINSLDLDPIELEAGALMLPISQSLNSEEGQLHLETRSALDVIRIVGDSVEIPEKHLEQGIVLPVELDDRDNEFLRIRSSATYPEFASVAVKFHDYWFYIDSRDSKSKRGFVLIRTLIGMRLYDANARSQAPTLTIPVGK